MSNKGKGFSFQLTVNEIDSIRPRESGSSTINGENVEWGHALKFKTRNLDLVDDKDFGVKEVETTLEIEVPCKTKQELIELNRFMLGLKNDGKSFLMPCTLPTGSGVERSCKATLSGSELIAQIKK